MTEREALKLALEALEVATTPLAKDRQEVLRAIIAIREALAQPEQEPVAYMVRAHGMLQRLSRRADVADEIACQYRKEDPNAEMFPLYTTPPQRKPLTDEEIQEVVTKAVRERKLSWLGFKKDDQGEYTIPVLSSSDYQMARAIEAAHGIKEQNT